MYLKYFGLTERPFSIAPDPHYLYMSARHKEAMAHLTYGLSQGGCFIVLTGEVGTGKTTLCRNLLSDLPDNLDVALILNANINEIELLQTICDELKIEYQTQDSQKQLLDQINTHLMATFAENRHTVLIIDEAQLLSRDVLEKVRLLTNLETTKSKLLQIILIGQPELNDLLGRNDLRQLAQRVTARYHLGPLERSEIDDYINFRLGVAGCKQPLFSRQALSKLHSLTGGIPRKINVLADHSLLSAYSKTQAMVDSKCVKQAASEVFIKANKPSNDNLSNTKWWVLAASVLLINIGLWWFFLGGESIKDVVPPSIAIVDEAALDKPLPTGSDLTQSLDTKASAVKKPSSTSVDDSQLTSILRSDEIEPGSVVIADEFLDESVISDRPAPGLVANLTPPTPRVQVPPEPRYDPDSEFGSILETSADITGRIAAFRNLGQAWDVNLPEKLIKSACSELSLNGVECLIARSWRQFLRFNRPSILVLEQRDQLHRAIVFKVEGDQAQVLVGENVHSVSVEELQARWSRDATVFWRPGDVGKEVLKQGESFASLPMTRAHMNKALTAANLTNLLDTESKEFDLDMAQKAFALQTRFGLIADGKVGNETYLLMNELVSPETTPVLRQRNP